MQLFTDGKLAVTPPISVDYPYRFNGDTGPGTGGMGAFTERGASYLTQAEVERTGEIGQSLVRALGAKGLRFNGVLNLGLFATPSGLKIIEANARPGDPECMNMMMLMEGSFPDTLESIASQTLTPEHLSYKDAASAVVYLVSKGYALDGSQQEVPFTVDHEIIEKTGSQLFFASAKPGQTEGEYLTAGSSRTLAVGAIGETLEEARNNVYTAITRGIKGSLDFRTDIGSEDYLRGLASRRGLAQ